MHKSKGRVRSVVNLDRKLTLIVRREQTSFSNYFLAFDPLVLSHGLLHSSNDTINFEIQWYLRHQIEINNGTDQFQVCPFELILE